LKPAAWGRHLPAKAFRPNRRTHRFPTQVDDLAHARAAHGFNDVLRKERPLREIDHRVARSLGNIGI